MEVLMQTRNAAVLSLVVLSLAACAAPQPQVDIAAEEQAVRALSMRWLELDKAKDNAGIAALFADDGVMYREGAEPAVGSAAIQAALAAEDTQNPDETVEWTTDRVEVAPSGDLAVEQGTWTSTTPAAAGSTQASGKFLTVHRKVNGEWKVVADMSITTTPPPPSTTTGN
jgi:uncharacterized protein (TIGR02246 family)